METLKPPLISVKYPKYNVWNDNPYYILKHKSSLEQQDAARVFLDYLLEKEQQLMALNPQYGGFRPVSPEVSQDEIDKVFLKFKDRGVSLEPRNESRFLDAQAGEVLRGLFYVFDEVKGVY